MSRISIPEFRVILEAELPLVAAWGVVVDGIEDGAASLRLPFREDFLRPGGTILGPVMMGLADVAMYAAVLSSVGPQKLAVTINQTTQFLRRPKPAALVADGRMIRVGRRVAYGECHIYSDGDPEPVAHATLSYMLPDPEAAAGAAPETVADA